MLRKILFWSHLAIGICVAIIVFIMSATGVVLTYEAQIKEWNDARHNVVALQGQQRITTDQVLAIARDKHPELNHIYIHQYNIHQDSVHKDKDKGEGRAIPVWVGMNRYLLHPYSGEVIQTGPGWVLEFLHVTTELHRWLALEGEWQSMGKVVTAYSNLLFIFLIVSGTYLWLPRKLSIKSIKLQLLFKRRYKSRHAKHFNWHHVFGFWALIPLFFIVTTATIFHFQWANALLYIANGEDAPGPREKRVSVGITDGERSYEQLFSAAKQHAVSSGVSDWHSMWIELGRVEGQTRFWIDPSLGNSYERAYELYLDNNTGEVASAKYTSDWSKGDQAWGVARFLHTGEYYGVVGQTIAGLASLASCLLVYSGLMLSWRRLIKPLTRGSV